MKLVTGFLACLSLAACAHTNVQHSDESDRTPASKGVAHITQPFSERVVAHAELTISANNGPTKHTLLVLSAEGPAAALSCGDKDIYFTLKTTPNLAISGDLGKYSQPMAQEDCQRDLTLLRGASPDYPVVLTVDETAGLQIK